jgi:predicted AAA+ superfamily ATPase
MALASPLRKVASKLMARFGGVATIRRVVTGSYDPATGTIAETNTDTTVRGVLEDVTVREVNELVQAGDKRLIIAAADLSTAPTTVDKVLINSVVHQVIRVQTIEQDNTAITYEMILRA